MRKLFCSRHDILGIFGGILVMFGGLPFGALKFRIGEILSGGKTAISGFTLSSVKGGMLKGPEKYFCETQKAIVSVICFSF